MKATVRTAIAALAFPAALFAQFVQQGPKLVGSGSVFGSWQGRAVALSADGNTAAVGGSLDNLFAGSTWVFTRSAGVWTQQGPKLVGSGATPDQVAQGGAVALSADGNTLIEGGLGDNSGLGAAWVFVRSGGVWSQQGTKLAGTGAIGGPIFEGSSVALSSDGNTAILGGPNDNAGAGAAWVFTRSGGVWTQQTKLTGTGAIGTAAQGNGVSLSADGNTAIVGGPDDNGGAGAAWVFTRSGGVWTQQTKLSGSGATGTARQGSTVAISADGTTALLGGPNDSGAAGATWVFTRSGSIWTQQGPKLVGAGAAQPAGQAGRSLSGDGNLALIGGPSDANPGAAWVFRRSGGVWSQLGGKLVGTGFSGTQVAQGASATLSTDGTTAIVGGPGDISAGAAWIFVAVPSADLAITKTVSPGGPFAPNQPATYTITVTNNGPGSSSGVTVTDALPAQVTFVSATPTQGSCSGTTTVTCSLGTLASGASASIAVAVTTGAAIGPVSNTATATASTTDPNPANNSGTATFTIVAQIPALSPYALLLLAAALAVAAAAALR